MKRKQIETFFYSTVGVIAVALILIAFNVIAAQGKQRIDLTAEKAYTLSSGTKAILARLDTPVQLRLYCTKNANAMPVMLRNYAQRVEDLLAEYQQAGKGHVEIQRLDPEPDSDAEDSAKLDGIEGQPLRTGQRIYLGLSASMLDQKQAIPFLSPERERLLEYDISRAIARVMTPDKPVIGVMSSLPVMGQTNPLASQRGQRGQLPLVFISELERDFNVRHIMVGAEPIPDDIKVLLVIHPKTIPEVGEYGIDQFVLRGGKLAVFVDPFCALDRSGQMGVMPLVSSSNLGKLFQAWGLTFDTTKMVADMEHAGQMQQGSNPAVLALNETAINKDDVLTANADNLLMPFSGAFTGTPADGLTETILVKSSKRSALIDVRTASLDGSVIATNFTPSDTEYPLAIRLAGKFKTAFPEGKPKSVAPNPDAQQPEENPGKPGLKESAQPTTVVLVGDADMIQDPATVREVEGGGRGLVMPINSNLSFAQGIIEQLAGDSNLIAVRSRASRERPFTVVQKLEADAEANYRSKIKELESSLTETQHKMSELQKSREGDQQFILSPEQQEELANFRKKEAEVKVQLKDVRKQLRTEIDSLENRVKWLNIAVMPAVVILAGFGRSMMQRKRAGK